MAKILPVKQDGQLIYEIKLMNSFLELGKDIAALG